MKTIKIFLASSHELKRDREQFEIEINRKNKAWAQKGIFLHLEIWEDLSSRISSTRSQDEYNKKIKESDIFILLACNKVGMYTAEEFDTAFGAFKATSKPFIFTWFREPTTTPEPSLQEFKEKLAALGHFHATYSNSDDLWNQFNKEFERLEGADFEKNEFIYTIIVNNQGANIQHQYNAPLNNPVFNFGEKKHLWIFLFIIVSFLSIGFSYFFYEYQRLQQPLQLTVALRNITPNAELPPANGLLTLAYGDKIDSAKNVVSETIFKGIPANFRNKPVHLSFDAKGFIHRDTTLVLPQEVLYLPIARDNSLGVINGRITDSSNNQPLEGVKINVQELACYTDSTGRFLLHIPFDKQRINQRISTFLKGYKSKEVTTPVIANEPVMLNLEKY